MNLIDTNIITKLRGTDAWDFGNAECTNCGASVPETSKTTRVMLTGKAVYFHLEKPCQASIVRGSRITNCLGTRARIRVIDAAG